MSKCALAKLLKEEIYNLTRVAEALGDGSSLCYPGVYDYSQYLNEAIRNLKKLENRRMGTIMKIKGTGYFFEKEVRYN